MRTRIITGRLRRVAWLGALGALLAFLAVPFVGASSAAAYPGFTVSVTCTATNTKQKEPAGLFTQFQKEISDAFDRRLIHKV